MRKANIALSLQPLASKVIRSLCDGEKVDEETREALAKLDERQRSKLAETAVSMMFAQREKYVGELARALDRMKPKAKKTKGSK